MTGEGKIMQYNYPAEIGRVAISRMGRDKGRVFLITEILEEPYVMVADGGLRKLKKPKKKKLKHLKLQETVLTGIKEKLMQGTKVFDAELRSALKNTQAKEE
ncbi:MAG: RNA-binding protein [Christensenella sp.]